MADDSFYQTGAGTQHPNFGPTPSSQISINSSSKALKGIQVEHGLRPVIVRQMLEAQRDHSEANFVIDGVEVKRVTVVAEIISLDTNLTCNAFCLEDGTRGRIIARQWNSSVLNGEDNEFREHVYVRVIGELSRYKDRNSLVVQSIRTVTDFHEIYFHLLDVMVTTLTFERGPPPRNALQLELITTQVPSRVPGSDESDVSQSQFSLHTESIMVDDEAITDEPDDVAEPPLFQPSCSASPCVRRDTPVHTIEISNSGMDSSAGHSGASRLLKPPPAAPTTGDSSSIAARPLMEPPPPSIRPMRDPYSRMTALQRDMVLYISKAGPPESLYPFLHSQQEDWGGVHVTDLARAMLIQRHATEEDFSNSLDFLEENGFIYTTVDDSHFKLTPI